MPYYNTTKEDKEQVKMFADKNANQDKIVLEIANKINGCFSASKIFKKYTIASTPITSIRRSINTLKSKGLIVETGRKVKGIYGRKETQYEIC